MARRRSQQGQVLVLGMLLAALLGVAWMRYFGVGQVIAGKTRLVHGLDAAAYSGALVQARTLNFLAYVNRARLAHQLAMAHLVTLGSWAHFGGTQANRLTQGNPPAHLIGMLFGADHGRAYLAAARAAGMDVQASVHGDLGRAWTAHDRFIHTELAELSRSLVDGLPRARQAAVLAVLADHYPEKPAASLQVEFVQDDWPALVLRRPPDRALTEFVRQLADLYPFLGPRDHTARNTWSVDARCPWLRHELRRRGGTALDASGHWQAGDTESFHAVRSNRWIGCYYREYPMAWAWMPQAGASDAPGEHAADAPGDFSDIDFWRWVQAATQWDLAGGASNPLANSYAVRDRLRWESGGLAAYEDVQPNGRFDAAAGFVLRMIMPDATGLPIRAQSAAESFFLRPAARPDGREEMPNLFHPFWHARLARALQ